jgi:hypothetical protein
MKESKTDPVQEWVAVVEGTVNREDDKGQIWWMYFMFMYENRTMKPGELVLKKQGGQVLVAHACNPRYSEDRDQSGSKCRP